MMERVALSAGRCGSECVEYSKEKEMIVYLKKEEDNEYDKEAISVNLPGLGKIGYVANSPYTVLGESYSAGRLYDKMSEEASGKVKFKLDKGVICELME